MSICSLIDHELPRPGSTAGYSPSAHVVPLVLMLAGGGRTLEDLRVLRHDEGLRSLLQLEEMPSSDATGDWLRRMGGKESGGLPGLQRVNRGVFRRLLPSEDRTAYTLDIDATQIVAQKREAHYTYKGEKGYMPMVGHITELGLVIGYEFREGNAAPAAGNLEFVQACERNMTKGKKIVAVRADSAAYQAAIFNYCEETGKVFAIGADQDAAVKAAITAIPEGDWKKFRDGEIAETVHCMNKTKKVDRHASPLRPGLVRGEIALSLSRHRQQSRERRRASDNGMVLQTRRRQRKPHQGFEDRLRHGIHAVRDIRGQRRVLRNRCADLQSVSWVSRRGARKRMGARTSADHALAAVSDGGQDRTAWSADVFEDQRGHAGDVCGDPRALHAHHAGRRRCSRNVVIIWRFHFRDPSRRTRTVDGGAVRKTPRQRQNRRPKPPPRGSTRRRRPPCGEKRSENQPSDPRARVTQNPIADFGYHTCDG